MLFNLRLTDNTVRGQDHQHCIQLARVVGEEAVDLHTLQVGWFR